VPTAKSSINPTSPPEILFCARLQERKRPLAFVEMANLLTSEGVDARYTIIGPDEGMLGSVKSAIARFGLSNRVFYEGSLPYEKVIDRVARASVYVLPSVNEPFPMSLLEALSLGVPSICTDSCGIADDLRRADAAIVCDPVPSALATAVQGLLCDETEWKRLSLAGQQAVDRLFDVGRVVDQLEQSYFSVSR
jgi:glycosyltransferase involved in cell wall biosynthesis